MATAKVAVSSIMDTVQATATSINSLIGVTTKGIGMLDALVTKVSSEQKLRHKKEAHQFVKNLVREAAEEEASANVQVLQFCSKSKEHKDFYGKAYDEFSELFAEELGTKASE